MSPKERYKIIVRLRYGVGWGWKQVQVKEHYPDGRCNVPCSALSLKLFALWWHTPLINLVAKRTPLKICSWEFPKEELPFSSVLYMTVSQWFKQIQVLLFRAVEETVIQSWLCTSITSFSVHLQESSQQLSLCNGFEIYCTHGTEWANCSILSGYEHFFKIELCFFSQVWEWYDKTLSTVT